MVQEDGKGAAVYRRRSRAEPGRPQLPIDLLLSPSLSQSIQVADNQDPMC